MVTLRMSSRARLGLWDEHRSWHLGQMPARLPQGARKGAAVAPKQCACRLTKPAHVAGQLAVGLHVAARSFALSNESPAGAGGVRVAAGSVRICGRERGGHEDTAYTRHRCTPTHNAESRRTQVTPGMNVRQRLGCGLEARQRAQQQEQQRQHTRCCRWMRAYR